MKAKYSRVWYLWLFDMIRYNTCILSSKHCHIDNLSFRMSEEEYSESKFTGGNYLNNIELLQFIWFLKLIIIKLLDMRQWQMFSKFDTIRRNMHLSVLIIVRHIFYPPPYRRFTISMNSWYYFFESIWIVGSIRNWVVEK